MVVNHIEFKTLVYMVLKITLDHNPNIDCLLMERLRTACLSISPVLIRSYQ